MAFCTKGSYQCLDCGEIFENRLQAMAHHHSTKHQNFELIGTDVKFTAKS